MSSGSIYAIGMEGTSLVKIGCTTLSVAKRLGQLQTGQPYKLYPLATVSVDTNMSQIERQIHVFLAAERTRGEWFDITMDEETLTGLIARAVAYIAEQQELSDCPHALGEMEPDNVGRCIKALRRQRGMSQKQLAEATDLPQSLLSQIESGKRRGSAIQFEAAIRIAFALGVSADTLAGGSCGERRDNV